MAEVPNMLAYTCVQLIDQLSFLLFRHGQLLSQDHQLCLNDKKTNKSASMIYDKRNVYATDGNIR